MYQASCLRSFITPPQPPYPRNLLDKLGWFGFALPNVITVHLDAGYDSKKTRSLLAKIGCT